MKRDADLTEGDSSILRYIKTLTSHQTNAKQQRMDRFMQKVKRGRPDDLVENVKPTGFKHQKVLKPSMLKDNVSVPQLSKGNLPNQNAKLDNSKFIAPSAVQGGETAARKRLQSKRPYEESHFRHKQRKKTKREKEITAIDSFDRFRFNKTSSPSKTPQHSAALNGNKVAKSSQPPRSKRETRNTLQKSEFIGVPLVQQQATNTLPFMTFSVPPQIDAHDLWNNSQPRFQAPEEIPSGTPQCTVPQQATYEHLVHVMESIFF